MFWWILIELSDSTPRRSDEAITPSRIQDGAQDADGMKYR